MRTVGILGGMGPEATVLLMQKLIAAVPARDDADHIPLIVHQNPQVPSRIRHLIDGTGDDPGPVLAQMARDVQEAGAAAIAMPCNTAHAYAGAIKAATPLPFLDMRMASVAQLPKGARVGLLASPAVRMARVFDAPFADAGLTPVTLSDDAPLLALIRRIKTGDAGAEVQDGLRAAGEALLRDCDHLLVACTEFSLIAHVLAGLPWTDSLDALVAEIAAFARALPGAA